MNLDNITARVLNASPLRLVIITYEIIIKELGEAFQSFDKVFVKRKLENSRVFLSTLSEALDMEKEISMEILSIYIYVNKLLNIAELKLSLDKTAEFKESVAEAIELLSTLLGAWSEIESKYDTPKENNHNPKIFAGLTYKKGHLAEYVAEEYTKSFRA